VPVQYEWNIETHDGEDIEDNDFADKLTEHTDTEILNADALVLVCDVRDYSLDRSWAYVKDGKLPSYFLDAYDHETRKVPKRFHKELQSRLKTIGEQK